MPPEVEINVEGEGGEGGADTGAAAGSSTLEAAAIGAVVAAETAVALAEGQAAAVELDAAERQRRLEAEGEEWRQSLTNHLNSVQSDLQTLREGALQHAATDRQLLSEGLTALAARQEALEAQYRSLIPAVSEAVEEAATGETGETTAEGEPAAGASGEVEAGPVSLGASLEAGGNSSLASASVQARKRRRWI